VTRHKVLKVIIKTPVWQNNTSSVKKFLDKEKQRDFLTELSYKECYMEISEVEIKQSEIYFVMSHFLVIK
jgi:hypothetical protein